MKNIKLITVFVAISACATAPKSTSGRADLSNQATATLNTMVHKDPGLQDRLRTAAGYAVFPNIGKGGFIAGGAYGKGVLYEHGVQTGYVDLSQASFGAQIGAQSFSELVVFLDRRDVDKVKGGQYSLGANVSGVVLTTGAAASAQFTNGVAVFVMPKGGAMAELSVSGQKINFVPQG